MARTVFILLATLATININGLISEAAEAYEFADPLRNLLMKSYSLDRNENEFDNRLPHFDETAGATKRRAPQNDNDWPIFIRPVTGEEMIESESSLDTAQVVEPKQVQFPVIAKASKEEGAVNKGTEQGVDRMLEAISGNSREIRLMGPDQKPVVMKDDVGTKMMIAIDNLQKEAGEVWDQVNDKLDKGWTELKTLIENAVAPSTKKTTVSGSQPVRNERETTPREQLVMYSSGDGYSLADDGSPTIGQQAEAAGTKIRGFLSEMGLNDDNKKKASDALTKAGDSVSAVVTKDIPDAFKKASSAVSDTVTKDIPDAFKNFFG